MGLESISLDRNPYSNYPNEQFEEHRNIEDLANNLVTAGLGTVGYFVAHGHRTVQNAIAIVTLSSILARSLGITSRSKQDVVLDRIIGDAKGQVDQAELLHFTRESNTGFSGLVANSKLEILRHQKQGELDGSCACCDECQVEDYDKILYDTSVKSQEIVRDHFPPVVFVTSKESTPVKLIEDSVRQPQFTKTTAVAG